jgi:conjugative transfer signal peptidase TraF
MTDPALAGGNAARPQGTARRRVRVGTAATALLTMARPRLLWNPTVSAPVGLYAVTPAKRVAAGDMVIARVPEPVRLLAARRHYIPANVPLVKRVAGASGDTVCALGSAILVNSRRVAGRLAVDGAGRPMPWWSGCVTLRHGALFLLMADSPMSFDGRYFGPTEPGDIIGKATLLWRR